MHLSLPRRRAGWIIFFFFQKSRQEAVVSVSGSQEGLESHGRINFGPHSSSLSPAGSSGRFESVIKGYSRTLCQIMEAGKRAPHSDPSSVRHGPGPCIPPRCPTAGTSVVPMVPLVRCLGAGSCPAVLLAPKDHLTRLCDSVRPASSQVQGHPPHSSEGSRCP